MIISLPLYVNISSQKKFILNLNNYRNAHYHLLNIAKTNFNEIIYNDIKNFKTISKNNISLIYTVYKNDRRKFDVANVCSVLDKFFCDALVDAGILIDDNYDYIKQVTYKFGGIDKNNPRVDVEIVTTNPYESDHESYH